MSRDPELNTVPQCPLCDGPTRQSEKVPDHSAYTVDCPNCGVYRIAGTSQAQLTTLARDEQRVESFRQQMRLLNEKGLLPMYPSGEAIQNHPWVVGLRGE